MKKTHLFTVMAMVAFFGVNSRADVQGKERFELTIHDASTLNRQIADNQSSSYSSSKSLYVYKGSVKPLEEFRDQSDRRACMFKDLSSAKKFTLSDGMVIQMIGEFYEDTFLGYNEDSSMGLFCWNQQNPPAKMEDVSTTLGSLATLTNK